MASERISQILPTVKCSDCGKDVEIRRLGDHLCSSQPPIPSLPIMKDKYKEQNTSNPIISPLQSPNGLKKTDYLPTTPPLMKDQSFDDFYNRPKNPLSPSSFRSNESSFDIRYGGTRKQSLGNIYQQSTYSQSTPNAINTNSSGALDNLMADLMNSMNDDIYSTQKPLKNNNSCHVCGEEFDYRDDVKTIGNRCYHKSCFVCRLCCQPFDQRRTHYEHEGKLYCERDFHVVKNRMMCAACDKVISPNTPPIKALGKFYHPGHIKCYHCYDPIDERTGWKEYQGRVYCRSDFRSLFIPKCRACNRPVEKEAVSAMDGKLQGKWHLECFGCHTCHRPFPDNTFYVFQDSPYCKRHYHQLNNSLCRTCDEPIEGPCAQTIEGWRFHPNCFGCNVCHYPITDIYYMFERKIYCETHIRQLQTQRNVRAEKRKTQFGRI
ncbi:hypothetical protein G6F44_001515 [Rhizopus delemar]|nr:hypothetical protein G6F44_001515 [Rhizopus delemar]